MNRHHARWLVAVITVTLASGWLGAGLNFALDVDHSMESPGTLVWITTPLIAVIATRMLGGATSPGRWRPRFRQAWRWYIFALLAYPMVTIATGLVAAGLGWGSFAGFQLGRLLPVMGSAIMGALLKNVFEEAVWRGYVTGEFLTRRLPDWMVYLSGGLVWGLWHLPYYLFFMPESELRAVIDVPAMAFAGIAVAVMLAWTVLFTEVYRLSGTIWTVVLMHALEDTFVNTLLLDAHLTVAPDRAWLISPVVGIVPAVGYLCVGLWLRRRRRAASRQR